MPFTSTSSPRVLETDTEDMQNREHSCFFSAARAAKDSGIALELARNLGLDLPLARATKEQYDRMIAEDLGELDNPASPSSRSKTATNIPPMAFNSSSCILGGLINQPTRKRTSRMVLPPKRCFSFRRISDLEICSSS